MKEKAVVIVSGGLDSTTLLYDVINQGYDVNVLSFNYGQRHKKELEYIKKTCRILNIPHKILSLDVLNEVAPSILTREGDMPEGSYNDENMKLTVVPNRNMVMLSLATAYAIGVKAKKLFYGAHAGDHEIYPDCRLDFVESMKKSIALCDWSVIELVAPYVSITKTDVVRKGHNLLVPFRNTWSCYAGTERPCMKCGTCQERTIAFRDNDLQDPSYTDEEWVEALKIVEGKK